MKILILFIFALTLGAKILISPIDAMKSTYPVNTNIEKKNILVNKKNALIISEKSQSKLKTNIFRVFTAYNNKKIIGFGILMNQKVRSKNAVILYMISIKSILTSIEIIAFNEPKEYLPSKKWNSQFDNIPTTKMLRASKDIPTISGATLSARSVTDGSRVAFAFYNQMIKSK